MSRGYLALASSLALALVVHSQDSKPTGEAKQILGTWEVVKAEWTPPGSTVEFTSNGKMRIRIPRPGSDRFQTAEFAYTIKADRITAVARASDGKDLTQTMKVKKATAKELVLEYGKGKTEVYRRK